MNPSVIPTPRPPGVPAAGVAVVVTGVGPVFGRGLTDALRAVDVPTAFVRDPSTAAAVAEELGACLVVAALSCLAGLSATLREEGVAGRVRLAVLVDEEDPERYRHVMVLGAHAVVPVGAAPAQMVAVLAAAARGYRLVPADALRALCLGMVRVRAVELPARELGWLRLVADGVTVAELAHGSAYSERQMYRLLGVVYRRLGAGNRTEALIAAQRAGLLTRPGG